MNGKKFAVISLGLTILSLVVFALPIIIIDPYFHYHAPLKNLEYPIDNQRYQNDGMLKNFSYDAIIIGSSMTINFKPEEFNQLFGTEALHVSFLGASYKEINNNVLTGLRNNPNTKMVLRGLDITMLHEDKDYMKYEPSRYPTYLYDENIFNDVNYVFNKEVFDLSLKVLENEKEEVTEADLSAYSKAAVLKSFERKPLVKEQVEFTKQDRENVLANVRQNITSTAEQYPQVTFYLFWTPYNICYWDEMNQEGKLNYMLEAEKAAIEEILKYENIKLFSFSSNTELICNLDNYCDQGHYSPLINSEILKWIKNGDYELTKENYEQYIEQMKSFLSTYNYDAIYQ